MTFDNTKTIISLRIRLFAATVLVLAYLILAYPAKIIKFPLLGLNETTVTLIIVFVYLIIAFIPMFLNYQFIYYSDEGENIVIRYFTTGITGGKKNSVEIYKSTFQGFKTGSKYFGLVQSIILFQKVGQEIAKYPPVYISALTKEQKNKLLRSLNLHSPKD